MGNRFNLKSYQVNAALEFFLHHMSMEQRRQLMTEMPAIYNALVERKVMATVNIARIEDGDVTVSGVVDSLVAEVSETKAASV